MKKFKLISILTLGLAKNSASLACDGTNNLTPNFGGSDCDRRWPRCVATAADCSAIMGTPPILAGDLAVDDTLRSSSGDQVVNVMKPELAAPVCWLVAVVERSGMRSRLESWISPSAISDVPSGTAVWLSFSRTSYTVKRIRDEASRPSQFRNEMVHWNWGLEQRWKTWHIISHLAHNVAHKYNCCSNIWFNFVFFHEVIMYSVCHNRKHKITCCTCIQHLLNYISLTVIVHFKLFVCVLHANNF